MKIYLKKISKSNKNAEPITLTPNNINFNGENMAVDIQKLLNCLLELRFCASDEDGDYLVEILLKDGSIFKTINLQEHKSTNELINLVQYIEKEIKSYEMC